MITLINMSIRFFAIIFTSGWKGTSLLYFCLAASLLSMSPCISHLDYVTIKFQISAFVYTRKYVPATAHPRVDSGGGWGGIYGGANYYALLKPLSYLIHLHTNTHTHTRTHTRKCTHTHSKQHV
jgi:hypothetical protein